MLEQFSDQIRRCYEHVAEAKAKADATDDPALKAEFLNMESSWLTLARSHGFTESLGDFTKANSERRRTFDERLRANMGSAPTADGLSRTIEGRRNNEGENFTVEQFNDLTGRILNEATKNDTPIDAALGAITRALGLMISILAQRPGVSVEQLTKLSQDCVVEYAKDALADIANKHGIEARERE